METIKHNFAIGDEVVSGRKSEWISDGTIKTMTGTRLMTSKGHKYSLFTVMEERDGVPVKVEKFYAVNGTGKWELKKSDTPGK